MAPLFPAKKERKTQLFSTQEPQTLRSSPPSSEDGHLDASIFPGHALLFVGRIQTTGPWVVDRTSGSTPVERTGQTVDPEMRMHQTSHPATC